MVECQKIINLLENTLNQPSKFRRKAWVEINDNEHGAYNANSLIKFKNATLKSSLSDFSDTYLLVKGTRIVANTAVAPPTANNGKKVKFKNCAPFTDCISEVNNAQIES